VAEERGAVAEERAVVTEERAAVAEEWADVAVPQFCLRRSKRTTAGQRRSWS